jgi:hypothetical protein
MTEDSNESQDKATRTWYPYVTKVQFDKFMSRLERTIPEQIDRDYMRAIIRTPSMIHRFLRGIEAMNLIDRDQQPTDLLQRLVCEESREQALVEILQDLYPELLEQWNEGNDKVSDNDIVSFFTERTGMGRDSANKMKMFFKYLITESNYGSQNGGGESTAADSPPPEPARASSQPEPARASSEPEPARASSEPEPARASSEPTRDGRRKRGQPQPDRSSAGSDRSSAGSDRSSAGSDRSSAGNDRSSEKTHDRGSFSRALSESQTAYLEAVQKMVRINVDGDWDEEMMRVAFDRLERLLDRIRRA